MKAPVICALVPVRPGTVNSSIAMFGQFRVARAIAPSKFAMASSRVTVACWIWAAAFMVCHDSPTALRTVEICQSVPSSAGRVHGGEQAGLTEGGSAGLRVEGPGSGQ
ncbi:MAG: hypothetical protein ACFHWZ_07795 [Phycisphaerales bacterium]